MHDLPERNRKLCLYEIPKIWTFRKLDVHMFLCEWLFLFSPKHVKSKYSKYYVPPSILSPQKINFYLSVVS